MERRFRRDSLFCPDELDSLFSYFDAGAAAAGPRSKCCEGPSPLLPTSLSSARAAGLAGPAMAHMVGGRVWTTVATFLWDWRDRRSLQEGLVWGGGITGHWSGSGEGWGSSRAKAGGSILRGWGDLAKAITLE